MVVGSDVQWMIFMATIAKKMKDRFTALLITGGLLAGCAPMVVDPNNRDQVMNGVTVSSDPGQKAFVHYEGPTLTSHSDQEEGAETIEFSLHAAVYAGRPTRFFLNVNDYYQGHWHGYNKASDSEGHVFQATISSQAPNCEFNCEFMDTLEIELSQDDLLKHKDIGITLRLNGPVQVESAPFHIPAPYLQGFLQKVTSASR